MKRGDMTPWGEAQDVEEIAVGVWCVSTARHGGYLLSWSRRQCLPEGLRTWTTFAGGDWYEEDQDAAIVVVGLCEWVEFDPYAIRCAFRAMTNPNDHYLSRAGNALKEKDPQYFERVRVMAEAWEQLHATHWEVVGSASCRDGFVMLFRSVGSGEELSRVLTDEEYIACPRVVATLPGQPRTMVEEALP